MRNDLPIIGLVRYPSLLIQLFHGYYSMVNDTPLTRQAGRPWDRATMREFYSIALEDVGRERARLGGDWVVAMVLDKQEWRDLARSILGPDLQVVLLKAEPGLQEKRLHARHFGDKDVLALLTVSAK